MRRPDDAEARLAAHVAAVEEQPVTWGLDDCTAWAVAWRAATTGVDLDLPAYASRDEAHALIAKAGDLASLWQGALADARIYPRSYGEPAFGDVAVVDMGRHGQVGMIVAHGGIGIWRTDSGVIYRTLSPRSTVLVFPTWQS